jgi:uncharacterized protein (DUF983 family)
MALLPRRRSRVEPPQNQDEPEVIVRLGFPTNCPVCGGAGYLDHIDLTRKAQRQHCLSCGRDWEISESGEIDLRTP